MPRRRASWADDLVLMPWWVSGGFALLAWLVLPAILPPAMRALSFIATMFFIAMACLSALRSLKTARMLDEQTGLNSLRKISSKRFEDLLGEAYRRQGYQVEETLGGGADGGVDLVIRKARETTIVQCKRWSGKPIPVQTVRELYGILHDRGATAAKLVVTTTFTPDAIAFANNKPIELIDGNSLVRLIRAVQTSAKMVVMPEGPDHLAPSCPRCGSEMVIRTAKRGATIGERFWGCPNFPRCRGKREL